MQSGRKNKKLNKRTLLLLFAAVLMIGAAAFTLALLFQDDKVTNRFTAASLAIELIEENYDALTDRQRATLVPNALLDKDPKIKNTDNANAFVFLKVTVPVQSVTYIAPDGTRGTKAPQELFYLKTSSDQNEESSSFNTADDGEHWVRLESAENGAELSGSTRTYVFGYSVYLRPDETTETLFDYIQLKNILQYELDPSAALFVNVEAYGIQADYLKGIEKDSGNVKAVMTKEQLETIYAYLLPSDE